MSAPLPTVQAMLLADYVHQDVTTGKKFILGSLNTFGATEFPSVHPLVSLFVILKDVVKPTVVEIRLVDLADFEVLTALPPVEVKGEDRLGTHEMVVHFKGFPLPHDGALSLEIHCEGTLIGSLRILVNKTPSQEKS